MTVQVIAHRGSSLEAPENTLRAFELALISGADGLELDVQLTLDGEPVVLHDETLDRTTSGQGYLIGHSYSQLRKLDAGLWFGKQFEGQKVPHLKEVLDLLHKSGTTLNIELKNGIIQYPGMEEKVLDLLAQYPDQKVIISSFNHYSLRHIKHVSANTRIGLLYMAGLVEPWRYAELMDAYSLHPLYLNIMPELVTGCKHAGIKLFPWTVDNPQDMERITALGVEGIITNDPARMLTVKGSAVQ